MHVLWQETSSNDVVAKAEVADSSSAEHAHSDRAPDVKSQPVIGQLCGIQRDGQLDVLWVDGSRSTTYVHNLYLIPDEVLLALSMNEYSFLVILVLSVTNFSTNFEQKS